MKKYRCGYILIAGLCVYNCLLKMLHKYIYMWCRRSSSQCYDQNSTFNISKSQTVTWNTLANSSKLFNKTLYRIVVKVSVIVSVGEWEGDESVGCKVWGDQCVPHFAPNLVTEICVLLLSKIKTTIIIKLICSK